MPNEFIIKNGFRSQGNSEVTGSLIVTGGTTGSLQGTASVANSSVASNINNSSDINQNFYITFVSNTGSNQIIRTDSDGLYNPKFNTLTVTASHATSASYIPPSAIFPYSGSAQITGSLGITGSISVLQGGYNILNTSTYTLKDSANASAVDWDARVLNDVSSVQALSWRNRALRNSSATTVLDWTNLILYDASSKKSSDWQTRQLYDSSTSSSIDWSNRGLADSSEKRSVFWGVRILYDPSEKFSADWGSRTLLDSTGTKTSIDWQNRAGYDSVTSASISWGSRRLYNQLGSVTLDWQNAMLYGTASYALSSGGGGGTPGGLDKYIQFNNSGSFGGNGRFTFDNALSSFAHGQGVTATGNLSHAQGDNTVANGYASHAEGEGTTATGEISHAEGSGTTANGYASHAEGNFTTTGNEYGYYAIMTASGVFAISSSYGDVSTAGLLNAGYIIGVDDSQYDNNFTFANLTVTSCSFNGTNTIVHVTDTAFYTSRAIIGSISNFGNGGDQVWGGYGAHAQGDSTTALGRYSHAEGVGIAFGQYSHAEGQGNVYGNYSHAEGASTAFGQYSHAEGSSTAYGTTTHAEGENTTTGYNGYRMNTDITAGVIELEPIYGDQTGNFSGGSFVLIYDNSGDIDTVNNTSNTYLYEVSSSAFTSSLTQITLVDNTVTTFTDFTRLNIGVYGNPAPPVADVPLGNASHAEGVSSKTMGEYSHAAGNLTETLGWYQSVVGIGNKPISTLGAFIVGDGTTDGNTRHNLLVAAAGNVTISGSLLMSGSILPSVSGSVTSSFSLGSATNAWKDIWVANSSIYMLDSTGSIQTTIKSSPRGIDITGSLHGTVSSIVKGEATVDFGSTPGSNYATTTISTPFVTNNSNIHIYIMSTASADHNAMEHQIFSLYGTVMPDNIINNTSFDIVALSQLRLDGTFKVRYTINNN